MVLAPLRLLLTTDTLNAGGAQRQLVTLAVALRLQGHEVDFLVYQPSDFFESALQDAGVRVLRSRKSWRYSLQPALDLRRRLQETPYDGVLAFQTVPNLYAMLARVFLRGAPPLVVSERFCPRTYAYRWQSRVIERLYRFADHLVVNSHHLLEHYRAHLPAIAERASTVWNGFDPEEFSPSPCPSRREGLRLLVVSRVTPFKDGLCLIRALRQLRNWPELLVHVDWAGRLDRLDHRERAYLREMKDALARDGLEGQWTWLGERADIGELLACHHALVHPSAAEGLPNAVCEALACGRIAIASDALDHPKLIQEGETGFLFAPGDPASLADAIAAVAELPSARFERMCAAAREFAETTLGSSRLAADYLQLFRSLGRARVRQNRVVFLGSFAAAGDGSEGGQLYACRTLFRSPLARKAEWRLIDTTWRSFPLPGVPVRVVRAGARFVRALGAIARPRTRSLFVFTAFSGASLAEKGLICILARMLGLGVVLCIQSGLPRPEGGTRLGLAFAKLVLACCRSVVCQSALAARELEKSFDCAPEKLEVIPNWLETSRYLPALRAPSDDRRGERVPVLLFIGLLIPRKGCHDLIDAAAELAREGHSFRLRIFGSGPDRADLEARARRLDLADRTKFQGWIPNEKMPDVFRDADVFVLPTYSEGLPNALLEAMLSGLPVVTTPVNCIPSVIRSDRNGALVTPGDTAQLVDALRTMLLDPELRHRIGRHNRAQILREHDLEDAWPRVARLLGLSSARSGKLRA